MPSAMMRSMLRFASEATVRAGLATMQRGVSEPSAT